MWLVTLIAVKAHAMSQIELAVSLSRRLESLLEEKYQATGKGLHEKVSSIETTLPSQLVKSLRYIATIRNSVVHEEGFVIEDLAGFSAQGDAALAQLGGTPMSETKPTNAGKMAWDFERLQGFLTLAIIVGCSIGGAVITFLSFGGVGSVVMGLIGGAVVGVWVPFAVKKVLEFLLGLFIIICVLGLAGAILKLTGVM